jgi:pimeloyl-ACP methyl ester carboxylesterase
MLCPTYQLFASADAVHAAALPGLAMPALFMTGECDPNSSPDMSRAMALAPQGQLDIVAAERHMMNVTAPERSTGGCAFSWKPPAQE